MKQYQLERRLLWPEERMVAIYRHSGMVSTLYHVDISMLS